MPDRLAEHAHCRCGHSWGQHYATGPLNDCLDQARDGCGCVEYLPPTDYDEMVAEQMEAYRDAR